VARINDEVTVKTLTKISDSQVILRPENSSYSDIEVNPKKDNLIFEGTCVGLLRDFS
jgi:SOS-response transcriptional repressor LexA